MKHALKLGAAVATTVASLVSAGCRTAAFDPELRPAPAGSAEAGWFIFIDDLHLQFRDTGYLRELLRTVSNDLIREGEVFAVASSGPLRTAIPPTADRGLLDATIGGTAGAGLTPATILDILSRRAVPNEIDYRAGLALAAARELIATAERVRSPRKAVIWISNGHGFDPPPYTPGAINAEPTGGQPMTGQDLRVEFAALVHHARRAGVRVFAVEPRPAVTTGEAVDHAEWHSYLRATRSNLRALCEQTGGLALLDTGGAEFVKAIRERNAVKHPPALNVPSRSSRGDTGQPAFAFAASARQAPLVRGQPSRDRRARVEFVTIP